MATSGQTMAVMVQASGCVSTALETSASTIPRPVITPAMEEIWLLEVVREPTVLRLQVANQILEIFILQTAPQAVRCIQEPVLTITQVSIWGSGTDAQRADASDK